MSAKILVIDDDAGFRGLVAEILAGEGYQVSQAADGETGLRMATHEAPDLVLTDQRMPGLEGLELIRRLRAFSDPPAVILVTAFGTIPEAVEAVRLGADDYLTKPLESPAALRRVARQALGERSTRGDSSQEFLTRDSEVLELLAFADRAAATDATILVSGESGTGKEILARRIHRESTRADGPFVAVNCAALPETLAESELFGHEKGAFTGAAARHRGRFEQADGGTLLLDEVGELSEAIQAKLLRALEGRQFERVGGSHPVPVDFRLVAATNRDLRQEVAAGRFREDLFYRLDVVSLHLSPLRERPDDVIMLAEALTDSLAGELGLPARPLTAEAAAALRAYPWPGNVRELRNALERALIAGTGDAIQRRDLPALGGRGGVAEEGGLGNLSLRERERRAILEALERSSGNRQRAAEELGISVRTLYNRLKEYGIR